VDETAADDDGLWHRSWLLRVMQYKHVYSAQSSSTSTTSGTTGVSIIGPAQSYATNQAMTLLSGINYIATLLEEDLVRVPTLIVPGVSSGVLISVRDPYGIDLSDDLPWLRVIGDELVFDTTAPAFIDGDELVILSSAPASVVGDEIIFNSYPGGEDMYFDDVLPWITLEGDELVFDTSAPAFIDGDELVVLK
jgi:hypothetical protein